MFLSIMMIVLCVIYSANAVLPFKKLPSYQAGIRFVMPGREEICSGVVIDKKLIYGNFCHPKAKSVNVTSVQVFLGMDFILNAEPTFTVATSKLMKRKEDMFLIRCEKDLTTIPGVIVPTVAGPMYNRLLNHSNLIFCGFGAGTLKCGEARASKDPKMCGDFDPTSKLCLTPLDEVKPPGFEDQGGPVAIKDLNPESTLPPILIGVIFEVQHFLHPVHPFVVIVQPFLMLLMDDVRECIHLFGTKKEPIVITKLLPPEPSIFSKIFQPFKCTSTT